VLEGSIAGRTGATPYVRYGDAVPLGVSLLVIVIAVAAVRLRRPAPAD
jgi:apolipoprotein N-acyltransferase